MFIAHAFLPTFWMTSPIQILQVQVLYSNLVRPVVQTQRAVQA